MGRVGQSHVQAFNPRHKRCGALWQGRFKSCLVQSERYLLTVMRYIELNPVRAAMVASPPEEYRWSSVHTHLARARAPHSSPLTRSTSPLGAITWNGLMPISDGWMPALHRMTCNACAFTPARSVRLAMSASGGWWRPHWGDLPPAGRVGGRG
ncbi:transposase [Frateuria sp. GZRe14]|uniref:transposase n=1 Tax=Frateuria sp. GZRe14 TaxID=3351534 RepID=UPI003EDC334F